MEGVSKTQDFEAKTGISRPSGMTLKKEISRCARHDIQFICNLGWADVDIGLYFRSK